MALCPRALMALGIGGHGGHVSRCGATRSKGRADIEGASEEGSGELGRGSPHPHLAQEARGREQGRMAATSTTRIVH